LERRYVGAAIIPPTYMSSKDEMFGGNIEEEQIDPDELIDPEKDMLDSMSKFRQKFLNSREPLEYEIRRSELKKIQEVNKTKKDNSGEDKES
jgi:hypothetical protein